MRVKSADRSLDLLELLAAHPEGITFAEIARELGLPKSSAHGLLQTLIARRYAEVAADGRHYRLGPKAGALAGSYHERHGVLSRARAALWDIAIATGETVRLAQLDEGAVVYHAVETGSRRPESIDSLRLIALPALYQPPHHSAAGRAILAWLPSDTVAALYERGLQLAPAAPDVPAARFSAATGDRLNPLWPSPSNPGLRAARPITSMAELQWELEEIRTLGYAHDAERLTAGVHEIAVPVFDAGRPVASLALSVPAPGLDASRLRALVAILRRAAAEISSGTPPAHSAGEPPVAPAIRDASGTPAIRDASGTPAISSRRSGQPRIGWSLAQPFSHRFVEVRREVSMLAASSDLCLLCAGAGNNELKQACDVLRLLELEPDVLVVNVVNPATADALFRAAAAGGVPSICLLRPARSDAFDVFVGWDTYQQGVTQIEFVAERLGGYGNVVLLEGDPYSDNARNIADGSRDALARHSGLRLVADEPCPFWLSDTAYRLAVELLDAKGAATATNPNGIHAFVCAHDGLAAGVARALADRDLAGRVLLVGAHGTTDALERIRTGVQTATVLQPSAALARIMLQTATALASGQLDPARLPRRRVIHNPPTREMPVVDVPQSLITQADLPPL